MWRASKGAHAGEIERIGQGHAEAGDGNSELESFIHFELDRCGAGQRLEDVRDNIARVLGDGRAAVEDWPKLLDSARAAINEMKTRDTTPDGMEARAFLEWMVGDHFTFLGCRDYDLVEHEGGFALRGVQGSGMGLLRETLRAPAASDVTPLPPGAAAIIEGAAPIFLTKANSRATVHRLGYLDYVGVKRVAPDGKVIGERCFLGLYTSTAYLVPTSKIPIVRRAGFLEKGIW